MNCKGVMKEITDYLDGVLDEDLKRELNEHLKCCQHCQVLVDTTRKTIELYCDGKLYPLPDQVRDRLHAALRRKFEGKAQ